MLDYPKELRFFSEELEPTFARLIGKWYVRSKHCKDTYGPHSARYVDAMQEWWYGMEALNKLMIVTPEATHAQVAFNNDLHAVKRMIEKELDIEFSFLDKNLNFRGLVKFRLEFPEFDSKWGKQHEPA